MPAETFVDPTLTRRLHRAVEPIAQLGYAAYAQRRRAEHLTPMEWYFGGRLACAGAVTPHAAAAILAVLEPTEVIEGVRSTWAKIDAPTLFDDRLESIARFFEAKRCADVSIDTGKTVARLQRAADALEPAGHVLFASWRSHDETGDALVDLWATTVAMREHRGAAHINAWRAAGLAPVEILVLTEARMGLALGSHAATMRWPRAAVDRAIDSLRTAGLLSGESLSEHGAALREEIEAATDHQELPALRALGDELADVCGDLERLLAAAG
jgi:hypothetical protein